MRYEKFVSVYRDAKRQIKKGKHLEGAMEDVMRASRYLDLSCTAREINLALAYAVLTENSVQPTHVHPADLVAAKRCIGSNGHHAMPIRDWEYEG